MNCNNIIFRRKSNDFVDIRDAEKAKRTFFLVFVWEWNKSFWRTQLKTLQIEVFKSLWNCYAKLAKRNNECRRWKNQELWSSVRRCMFHSTLDFLVRMLRNIKKVKWKVLPPTPLLNKDRHFQFENGIFLMGMTWMLRNLMRFHSTFSRKCLVKFFSYRFCGFWQWNQLGWWKSDVIHGKWLLW